MKQKFIACLLVFGMGLFAVTSLQAQDTTSVGQDLGNAAKKTGRAIGKGAKKVGNKTAELASKGKAGIVDKVYDGKEGHNGELIYINKKSKYYSVDKKGHRQYYTEAELKDKS